MNSTNGYSYYVIFVDLYSRYVGLYPIKFKSEVSSIFLIFKSLVENQLNTKIKTLYSNNGGEYIKLRSFLQTHGISHLTTPPLTPEHNGISECKYRHLVETARCLLQHASLPLKFWGYTLQAATYLINHMPTLTLAKKPPLEVLFGCQPNYHKLGVFGRLCYPWLTPYTTNKLQTKSNHCVFLGYSLTQSAYLCFDPMITKLFTSRQVEFVEDIFPYSSPSNLNSNPTPNSSPPTIISGPSLPPTIISTSTLNSPKIAHYSPTPPILPLPVSNSNNPTHINPPNSSPLPAPTLSCHHPSTSNSNNETTLAINPLIPIHLLCQLYPHLTHQPSLK